MYDENNILIDQSPALVQSSEINYNEELCNVYVLLYKIP